MTHLPDRPISRRLAIQLAISPIACWVLTGCNRSQGPSASNPPPPPEVGGCKLDEKRLLPLRPCMECCGPLAPRDAWNHSCIHPETAAYSCGRLYVPGEPNVHDHDPDELILCKTLANEAAKLLAGVEVNLSESSSVLHPFYITANRSDERHERVTASVVRDAFNGAVYPKAKITVSPLQENSALWESFVYADDPLNLAKWRQLIDWFSSRDELHSPSFVEIGDGDQMSDVNFGCDFPRLVVALTKLGSLVGVCGHAVHT